MNQEQQQFVEDMGQLMASWSLPRTTGRIYGYLLLQGQPVSQDQIAVDLEMAKSGVSVAARQLLALGLARSAGQRGSRRLLYEALYDLEAIIAARNAHMLNLIDRLREGARAARPGPARERLTGMAAEIQSLMDAVLEMVEQTRAKKRVS